MPKFNVAPEQAQTPELPVPEVSQNYDEAQDVLNVTAAFAMNYPDEAVIVSTREKDGKERVTNRIYGVAKRVALGIVDPEGNPMYASVKIYAPNPAEEKAKNAEAAASDED